MTMSRILVIGGTGMMGRRLVAASLAAGLPTAVLVRPAAAAADDDEDLERRAMILENLKTSGASLVHGDINDHERLVAAMKQADVVISAVGHSSPEELELQLKIVVAMQEAGNVKRFVPSEYGSDVELAERVLEPGRGILRAKLRVRRALTAAGIPHTIICSYWAHGFMLPRLGDPEAEGLPSTRVTIYGDGKRQSMFINEMDMSMLVIKTVEDPRTLDKIVYVRPPMNLCSLNQIVSLWEDKIGKTLQKYYVPEEDLMKKIQASPPPLNMQLAMVHWTFVAGACERTIGSSAGVEATELYPDMKFVSVDDYLHSLLVSDRSVVDIIC